MEATRPKPALPSAANLNCGQRRYYQVATFLDSRKAAAALGLTTGNPTAQVGIHRCYNFCATDVA
jgi:hypothetical protein